MKIRVNILKLIMIALLSIVMSCNNDKSVIETENEDLQEQFEFKYQNEVVLFNTDKSIQAQFDISYNDLSYLDFVKSVQIEYVYDKNDFLNESNLTDEITDNFNDTEKPDAIINIVGITMPEKAVGYIITQNNTNKANWETYIWWRSNGVFGSKVKRTGNKKVHVKMYEDNTKVLSATLRRSGETTEYINVSNSYNRFITKVKSRSSYNVYFARCYADGNCVWIQN